VQRRVADVTIDLFAMIACISRASAHLNSKGPGAEREAKLCRAFCSKANHRIKRNIRRMDDNNDELLKVIAKDAYDILQYPYDVVLD